MKSLLKVFSIIVLLCLINLSTSFSQYVLNGDLFSIVFPVEPTLEVSDIDTDLGKVKMFTYSYQPSDYLFYAFSYCDYPPQSKGLDEASALDKAMKGFANGMSLDISSNTAISLGNVKGVYFKADDDEIFATNKSYFVKNRLYQIAVVSSDYYCSSQIEASFLDSFKIK